MQQEVIEGYRLSPQQEYLWLLCQQDGAAHRTQCALRLEGELHKSFLKEALQQVVEQHEIMRTAFRGMPGMNLPLQVILEHGAWSWREVDLGELAEAERSSQLAELQRAESEKVFKHEQGEVLSACLALLTPARHVLLLNISPLCADSWSLQNLVRELGRRYTARLSGAEVALEAVQYADYSEWQHELLNTEDSAGKDFWRQQNVSGMPVLRLPLENSTGAAYRPAYVALKSDAELVQELEALARANDISLSVILLAAWSSLLWRLTGESELVVGAAVDGSRYKELHESLGLFTKYLPVPLRLAATSSFPEIIRRVAASYRDICRWQEYYMPGEGRAAEEGMGYEYEEREETVAGYGPLRVEVISEESCRSRQRVLLQCRYQKAPTRLELRLRYDGGCYSPEMIKLLAKRLETWLQTVAAAPRAELSRVTLLGEAERGLLREWGTGRALERTEECETLGELLEQQARQQGETAAVVGVEEVLTFRELNARANQWGRYLRKRGVGPDAVVGILLERSSRMVECVCGVWKAGGAYLPLHPGTPPARLERVLKQAGVRLVVSERELAGLVAGTGVEVLEWEAVCQAVKAEEASEPEVAVSGANLAYVIYTSGSTGEPKGVMIEQRSVLHLLGGLRQEVYGEHDEQCVRVGMNAPLSFDASVKQLVQVLRGKTLVVIPEELRLEAGPLLSYLAQRAVDVLDCTPAQLRLLRADGGEAKWPGLLLVGGEAIDGELWQQLSSWMETESVNVYGPTEATVDTTWKRITGPGPTIGKPLPQVRVYLLDQHGEQVAIGQVGEVYIGGGGVARGYRHEAGLTAERFVPNSYGEESGGRLYRTGDVARYREDGELEYVGRTDRQVKLRGFRIELEEVEAALLEHEGVKASAAVVRRDEEKEERLVGYVVMRSGVGTRQLAMGEHRLPNGLVIRHQNRSETDYLYEEIFEDQIYLRYGLELPANPCVFDVGANIGMFSLYVSAQSPGARIYAFEPIAEVCESLQHNTELCRGAMVKVCRYGLGARSGREEFSYYPQFSARSGLAAYADAADEVEAMESLAEMAEELLAGVFESRREECELRSLSEVIRTEGIEAIDLLKIDVQRAELDVLKGVAPEDWQKIRQVSMELHDKQGGATEGRIKEIRELLEQSGFEVAVEQEERLRGTDRYNLYARQLRLGGLQRNARKRAAHDGNGAGNGHGPVEVEQGAVGTNIHSLYARRREAEEAAAELSEVRGANGTSRLWRESLALEAEEAEVSEAELRSYLRERLPEYMVPQVLVKLERMPLSRHGKVDYQRLPAPAPLEAEIEGEAARNEVEALLAGIWSEVLGLVRVGREENFFELGGHSLLATQVMSRVRGAFGVEVRLRELFERPTVKELSQSIERELRQGAGVSAPPIERRERVEELPLSFAQQRLWFIDQLEPGSAVYNVPVAVRLQGSLNKEALAQTLTEVMRRHEVLRTRFETVDGRAVQVIEAAAPIELAVEELSELEVAEREARMHEWAAQEAATPFDLSRGPLLRVQLLRLGEQEHVVLLTMHHIVSDGWSVGVLIKEVGALYAAYVAGQESPLAELPIQYADFALWQRAYLQGEVLDQQLGYWRRQLSDAPRLLDLPSDHPRPAVRTFRGGVEGVELDQELSEKLRALSQRESVTLFMLLLAAFKVLLLKYSGQADIVIGADVANRNRAETENLIGFFVNMLVLRTDLSGDPTFRELLQRVREVCLEAYAHQDLPFEKLVEELQPERSLSYAPLFQVVFVIQNASLKDLHLSELTLSTVGTESGTAKFDLIFSLVESNKRLIGNIEYSTDLFEAETIKRMLGHFQTLLAAVVADPAQQLSRLPLLTEEEEQQLAEWNNTSRAYPRETCIHQLFEAQVERTPDAVAISYKEQQLSYRELNHRANQLAHHLQKLGVEPGARVGLYLAHSLETLIAILGVLKAGAAYVPIDPEHPLARLNFIIEDAQIRVLLTETGLVERLATMNDTRLLCLDADWEELASESEQNPSPRAMAEDLAYVIYTSGSTGTPKGVKIQHRALVNYIWWAKDVYVQDEKLDFPLYSSLAFDLTVTSIFTPLLTGNRVVVYRPDRWQSSIAEILRDDQVGVLKLTPSHLSLLKDADNSHCHLKRLIVGGEAFESDLARQVYESFGGQVEIFNEYGPTEATVGCMIYRFDPARVELASVPIGRPAANVQIYLLDEHLLPVAEKVIGEVYIAGDGLAAGYLNRDDLTAASFICNPFRPEQRMYRTKDLARWLPEHEIDYVGRKDEQIKFHGYRVELNELRSVLNGYPGVRDSMVLVRKKPGHGNDRMIAYYAARQEIEPRLLRDFMAQSIIKETIPNVFVHLKKLPLTVNGKVNLKALPDLEESRLATKQIVLAQTPVEEVLAGLWSEVLGVRVGVADDFFELGGHSLLATQVMSRVREAFGVEVALRELFERPTVKELGQSIERELRQGAGVGAPPIERRERVGELPLSFAQQRLWFIDQLAPGGTVYNIPLAVRLSGALNVLALEQTLNEIIRRHEVLRTSFAIVDEQPVQVIAPAVSLSLTVQELTSLPEPEREAEVLRLVEAEAHQPFELSQGPLLRVKLWRLSESEHVVLLTMHHIITDGWSLGVLINEVAVLYRAFAAGEPVLLPELPVQYADFALWQRERLQGEELERQLSYWRQQLAEVPAILELPTDRPRPPLQTFNGADEAFTLSAESTQALQRLSRSRDVTLFMTLLAVWQVLLQRYSRQQDIVVGTSIANRNHVETERLIGFFVNMLVLRTNVSGDPTFLELLKRVKEICLGAYAHQDLPFEKLVEELQPERSLNHSPLFQVVFVLQNTPMGALELPGLVLSTIERERNETQFDLIFNLHEVEGKLSGTLQYNTDLFEAESIKRMLGHLQTLLAAIIADPAQQLSTLPLLTEEEEQQLAEWNNTSRAYPREACIHQLFEAQVERTPEAVAVSFGEQEISYRELNSRANQVAHYLRGLDVGAEVCVGVCLERSVDLVVALVAILKAGGAYVPLDPSYPEERLAFMLDDAQARVLLTQSSLAEKFNEYGGYTILLDAEERSEEEEGVDAVTAGAENLAYVIYTSGSTGQPKGVAVTHRAVHNLVRGTNYVTLEESDVVAQVSNSSFDAATFEIWGALLSGARLVIIEKDVALTPHALAAQLEAHGVTVMFLTPALFNHMARELPAAFRGLRHLLVGGEAVEPKWVREVLEKGRPRRLLNVYGPTETTTFATWQEVTSVSERAHLVPIGRPLTNVQIYLLDKHLRPVPVGVPGGLYIGGCGLARGYLDRPALTAERFIPDPFSSEPGARLYQTGDLARFLPDGRVEFLGRSDQQVKIRGFRVEPGEVEALLSAHPHVAEAVVVAREDEPGDSRLVAYFVAKEGQTCGAGELRRHLAARLPEYMVPQVLMKLERLPLTANGKVDRRALPAVEHVREETELVLAQTPVEEVLVGIWSEVLGVMVGVADDFFALGGHSLLATQVMSRVREVFGVEVGLRELFERPTVKELGQSIERELRQGVGAPPIERRERVGELPLSFAQQRLWFIDQLEPGSAFYNVPAAVRLKGSLNKEALEQTLTEVISRHEVLRTSFGTVGGRAVQVIEAAAPVQLEVVELSALEVAEREARVHEWAAQEAATPFDLSRGPLLRVKLLRLGEQEHVVLLTIHHIVMDGWSLGIFIREIGTLYEAFIERKPSPLPELAIQYADFALWQRAYLQGEVLEQQLKYWREQLAGAETVLKLPTDKPRPATYSYRGATHRFILPEAVTAPLRKLSQEQGCTLFMTLLASFKTLLYRYTEQEDILVGTAIANRNRSETEALIGFFVNSLVLRTDLSGNPSFRKLMQRVRETTLGAYVHQDMPFEKLVEELQPERNLSQAPLFQVSFGVHNTPIQTLSLPGLELSQMDVDFDAGRFDLTLWISESQDELSGIWSYNTDLFEAATIKRMQGHFETILQNVLAQPDLSLSEIEMLTEDEKEQKIFQKRERLESNARVLRTIRRKRTSMSQVTPAQTELN